ncbi:hypothetical protein CEXT_558331 [Caerostris extrusa]|uniref:Uncharacterized protein n=1 Tax=Caerostris extrusa TaxID=172846 RepID=A0AAV4XXN8_CAEEX|nr:hypothetical protein CEXT_558331 [Caerostris extrusa]
MGGDLSKAIGSADLITMIKFVSAAASIQTSKMIEKQLESEEEIIKKLLTDILQTFDDGNSTEAEVPSKPSSLDGNTLPTNSSSERQLQSAKESMKKPLIEFSYSTGTEISKSLSHDKNILMKSQVHYQTKNAEKSLLELDNFRTRINNSFRTRKALLPEPLSSNPGYFPQTSTLELKHKPEKRKTLLPEPLNKSPSSNPGYFPQITNSELKHKSEKRQTLLPETLSSNLGYFPQTLTSELKHGSIELKTLLPEPLSSNPGYFPQITNSELKHKSEKRQTLFARNFK